MKRTITILACFTILIVLIYGLFSLTLFDTSAKYTDYNELNHYYESKELYIYSENLSSQDNKYNIINYYNFDSIEIEINNSINNKQITNYDINYSLECNILNNENNQYKCIVDDTEKDIILDTLISTKQCIEDKTLSEEECKQQEYNYNLIATKNKHKFKIIKNNGTHNDTVKAELILKTTSPYLKTLKATYILNIGNENNNTINIANEEDYNSFCEYTINNNYHAEKTIKINIDTSKLIFDDTSDIYINKLNNTVDSNNFINSITFKLTNSTQIKLYKKDFSYKCNDNDINYTIIK